MAIQISCKYGIDPNFSTERHRKVNKFHDELASDYRFRNKEEFFKINVFNNVLDILTNQLSTRFIGMNSICKIFDIFSPKTLINVKEIELIEKCDKFQNKYADIIGNNFTHQFISIYKHILPDLTREMSVKQLCQKIISDFGALESDIIDVYTAMLLFYTLPVTSASAERAFSKLKLIKSYLRNKTGQSRLANLSLIAIENEQASKLDVSKLIENFANVKALQKI